MFSVAKVCTRKRRDSVEATPLMKAIRWKQQSLTQDCQSHSLSVSEC